jgi:hypothetical protein
MKLLLKNIIFYIYSFISTLIENILFKNSNLLDQNKDFHKKGFQLFSLPNKLDLPVNTDEYFSANPYLNKIILSEPQIQKIIKIVFIDNSFAKKISSLTSFNYNIDHITAYETCHIPQESYKEKDWFANLWHKDGPYSKNNIKIIVPLSDIDDKSGAMKIISSTTSSKYSPAMGVEKKFNPDLEFESEALKNILIFCPQLCLHKAGNPDPKKTRKQLIFQINPSSKWSFNKSLFKNQKLMEPKFPLLYNLFQKKNKKSELFKII